MARTFQKTKRTGEDVQNTSKFAGVMSRREGDVERSSQQSLFQDNDDLIVENIFKEHTTEETGVFSNTIKLDYEKLAYTLVQGQYIKSLKFMKKVLIKAKGFGHGWNTELDDDLAHSIASLLLKKPDYMKLASSKLLILLRNTIKDSYIGSHNEVLQQLTPIIQLKQRQEKRKEAEEEAKRLTEEKKKRVFTDIFKDLDLDQDKQILHPEDNQLHGGKYDCYGASCETLSNTGFYHADWPSYGQQMVQREGTRNPHSKAGKESRIEALKILADAYKKCLPVMIGLEVLTKDGNRAYPNQSRNEEVDHTTDHFVVFSGIGKTKDGTYYINVFENVLVGKQKENVLSDRKLNRLYLQQDGTLKGHTSGFPHMRVAIVIPMQRQVEQSKLTPNHK